METYRVRYRKCAVQGCSDIFSKKHRFPNPNRDIELFNIWLKQVGNPLLASKTRQQILGSYLVCDLHFSEVDRTPGTKRGLRRGAFPTQLLPQFDNQRPNLEINNVLKSELCTVSPVDQFNNMDEVQSKTKTCKICVVPYCRNTSILNPDKLFVTVPHHDVKKREAWFAAMGRPTSKSSTKEHLGSKYCCEDHFNVEVDIENYMYVKRTSGKVRFRPGVIPHIFDCQPENFRRGKVPRMHNESSGTEDLTETDGEEEKNDITMDKHASEREVNDEEEFPMENEQFTSDIENTMKCEFELEDCNSSKRFVEIYIKEEFEPKVEDAQASADLFTANEEFFQSNQQSSEGSVTLPEKSTDLLVKVKEEPYYYLDTDISSQSKDSSSTTELNKKFKEELGTDELKINDTLKTGAEEIIAKVKEESLPTSPQSKDSSATNGLNVKKIFRKEEGPDELEVNNSPSQLIKHEQLDIVDEKTKVEEVISAVVDKPRIVNVGTQMPFARPDRRTLGIQCDLSDEEPIQQPKKRKRKLFTRTGKAARRKLERKKKY
ncbi:uncharacterized protein [Euwallacea fornicatus]|uniref:uncharacterized protein n=1 Tax=Euwallacea fornicatus TaxID=995702 RepID=UPI00338E1673